MLKNSWARRALIYEIDSIKKIILFLAIAALTVSAVPTLTQASQELEEGYLDMSSPEIQAELERKIEETEVARTKALQGKLHSMVAEETSLNDLKKMHRKSISKFKKNNRRYKHWPLAEEWVLWGIY
ncbi:hypothetical protein C2W64_03673 [Brevibacillus laterosporus]|nr:hypothetical protein C2W64_03673 [Brevibacillus laterosporus]